MSFQYDQYLEQHRGNDRRAYEWICENLPELNRFIFQLRLKIKLMSDDDFAKLLKECDYQQTLYALYFRYC